MSGFKTTRILRFGDCDPAGIAYFPSYFHFLNGVHEEWWISLGLPWRDLIRDRRLGLPTVQFDTKFHAPSFMGDELIFLLEPTKLGTRSMTLNYTISRGETLLWQATQVIVATSLDTHQSIAWPDDVRTKLQSCLESAADV